MLESVVAGLDRLDVLLPSLAAQARAWRLLGVEPADYDVVGMVLIWSVEQVLSSSPGAVAAWRETYDLLTIVMKGAAATPEAPPPPSARSRIATYRWGEGPPRSERTPRSHTQPPLSSP